MTNDVRLIDANWILREIDHDLGCYEIEEVTENDGLYLELLDVVKMVQAAPTIDPESLRPKGRWEMRGGKRYCTNCGKKACVTRDYDDFWYTVGTDYCPNCGADMREG